MPPRGGRRQGAGAPKGNLNALKHAQHSRKFKDLVESLAAVPEVRDTLLAYRRRQAQRERKAQENARRLLIRFLQAMPSSEFNQKLLKILGVETPEKHNF